MFFVFHLTSRRYIIFLILYRWKRTPLQQTLQVTSTHCMPPDQSFKIINWKVDFTFRRKFVNLCSVFFWRGSPYFITCPIFSALVFSSLPSANSGAVTMFVVMERIHRFLFVPYECISQTSWSFLANNWDITFIIPVSREMIWWFTGPWIKILWFYFEGIYSQVSEFLMPHYICSSIIVHCTFGKKSALFCKENFKTS